MTGGRVLGWDAVRDCWSRQWETIDRRVEPLHVVADALGQVTVELHQVVLRGELIERMDIRAVVGER